MLAWIALAVMFAVLGFVLTVGIPTSLAYLGLEVMAGHAITFKWLYLFVAMALLRGLFVMESIILGILLPFIAWQPFAGLSLKS
nr:hypothetical protein [Streptococcus equi]